MKTCLEFPNKKRYNTQRQAEDVILLLDTSNVRAYQCGSCKGWHLTSSPNLKNKNP